MNISSLQTDYLNLDSSSGFGRNSEIANNVQTQCTFCGGTNYSAEKCFKGIRQEKEKLVRLVIPTTDKRNGHPENVLDVDMKTTYLKMFQIHQKIIRNGENKTVLMKKVIVHATTAKITAAKRYMNLWHVFLVMTNVLVGISVTVHN